MLGRGIYNSARKMVRSGSFLKDVEMRAMFGSVEMSVHDQARIVVWDVTGGDSEVQVVVKAVLAWHTLFVSWTYGSTPTPLQKVIVAVSLHSYSPKRCLE